MHDPYTKIAVSWSLSTIKLLYDGFLLHKYSVWFVLCLAHTNFGIPRHEMLYVQRHPEERAIPCRNLRCCLPDTG